MLCGIHAIKNATDVSVSLNEMNVAITELQIKDMTLMMDVRTTSSSEVKECTMTKTSTQVSINNLSLFGVDTQLKAYILKPRERVQQRITEPREQQSNK